MIWIDELHQKASSKKRLLLKTEKEYGKIKTAILEVEDFKTFVYNDIVWLIEVKNRESILKL